MHKRRIRWLVIVALGVGLMAAALYRINTRPSDAARVGPPLKNPEVASPVDIQTVHLYYGDLNLKYLRAEARTLKGASAPQAMASKIIQALIKGPLAPQQLVSILPADLRLKALYVDKQGIAHVDLNWPVASRSGSCGQLETLQLYALVNSLVLNLDAIRKVQLLIDGQPATTLAGHMDISRALGADMMLIR